MALNGSFRTNTYTTSSSGSIGLALSWRATQDIETNSTRIYWTLTSYGTMSSGYYIQGGPITVTIGGKTVLSVTSRIKVNGDGGYKKTGNLTVTHNEDGTKTVAMSVKAALYSTSVNCTGSKSFTLDKIDRYALISSVENFDDESNPTIYFTNPAGTDLTTNLKMCMRWQDAGGTDQATDYVDIPETDWAGGSITLNLDSYRASLRNSCPNSNSLAVTFDLQSTLNSTDYHDTMAATMNIVNADPTFTVEPSYQDAYPAITGYPQVIVQKQSKLRIYHGTAQSYKGATLNTYPYSLEFNGHLYPFGNNEYIEFDKPDLAGIYRATITAVDTRGNTSITYISIAINDWASPTADYIIERQNGFDEKCDLVVNAHFSPIDGLNSVTITEKHRVKGTQIWSGETTITDGQITEITLNNTYEYEVEIAVTDIFETHTYTAFVSKGIPLFFWDAFKNSIAFNEIPDEEEQFKIGGTLKVKPNDTDAGVKLPHVFSETEQIVGYWLDGSPIYEKTIEFQTAVTVNANAWNTNVYTNDVDIAIIESVARLWENGTYTYWGFIAAQTSSNDTKIVRLYNSRDSACSVNSLTIRYIKIT